MGTILNLSVICSCHQGSEDDEFHMEESDPSEGGDVSDEEDGGEEEEEEDGGEGEEDEEGEGEEESVAGEDEDWDSEDIGKRCDSDSWSDGCCETVRFASRISFSCDMDDLISSNSHQTYWPQAIAMMRMLKLRRARKRRRGKKKRNILLQPRNWISRRAGAC